MFDVNDHAGERAELYALGELTAEERAAIDRHAARCAACAARLGEAEATVLQLVELEAAPANVFETRRIHFADGARRAWIAAVAAAFIAGLLPWAVSTALRHREPALPASQQLAAAAMLHGHFLHASFVPVAAGAPAAKAIVARDGSWLYVIVAPGSSSLGVAVTGSGRTTRVASVGAGRAVRSVFVRLNDRIDGVELLERSSIAARATIELP